MNFGIFSDTYLNRMELDTFLDTYFIYIDITISISDTYLVSMEFAVFLAFSTALGPTTTQTAVRRNPEPYVALT